MIKHIVMFKLTEYENEEDRRSKIMQMKEVFGSLKGKIEEISAYEVGVNINNSEVAYDLVIDSAFETNEALNTYINHAEHLNAIKINSSIAKIKAVVDYEI